MALALDRKAFIDILTEGQGQIGAAMLPPPAGLMGHADGDAADAARLRPGHVEKNRAEAREIMEKLGYGPDKRLAVKVSTRNIAHYRDPAVILIDQLKQIYIDGELETIETANWFPKITRKDYTSAEPDRQRRRRSRPAISTRTTPAARSATTAPTATRSSTRCSTQQSMETDQEKRKKLVWEIERKLPEDDARPIIFHNASRDLLAPAGQGPDAAWSTASTTAGASRTSGSTNRS